MNRLSSIVIFAAALLLAHPTSASAQYVESEELYYRIGGAIPVSAPVTMEPVNFAGGRFDGFSCGAFNPKLDVSSMLRRLTGTSTGFASLADLGSIPTGITSALPGNILCRAQPVLCQLTQHYSVRSEDAWRHSVNACDLIFGSQPSTAWQRHAKSEEWQRQFRRGASATQAHRQVEETDDPCITWVGGQLAGCPGKPPLRPVRDTVSAGWCVVNGQPVECTSTSRSTRASETWKTPEEAADWVADVVGDVGIQSSGTPPTTTAIGLQPKIEEEKNRILETLQEIYGTAPRFAITQHQQDVMFHPAGNIQPNVVRALYDFDGGGIGLYADRVATEAATARVIDQALLAHRLLLTGQSEPNIATTDPAKDEIKTSIDRLEKEIDRLAWEFQIRRAIVADTSLELMRAHRIMQSPSTMSTTGTSVPVRNPLP